MPENEVAEEKPVKDVRSVALALLGAATVAGCTSTPIEQMPVRSSFTVAGDQSAVRSDNPSRSFKLSDEVWAETVVAWDPKSSNENFEFWLWSWRTSETSAGYHDIYWKWYTGDQIVATDERMQRFKEAPFAISGHEPANALGDGHHRVEVYLDGRLIDTQEFDIS
jgi:hypothetical protein